MEREAMAESNQRLKRKISPSKRKMGLSENKVSPNLMVYHVDH